MLKNDAYRELYTLFFSTLKICNKRKGIVDDCMDKEIIEYAVQLKKVRTIFAKKQIQSSEDIVNIMKHFYDYEDKEKLYVVLLDSRRSVMGINLVSVGTSDSVMIHPGEVFKMAILMGAAVIVMVHNHPSGNVDPSLNDREATDRMIECGKVLDIPLIDHIIFSEAGYYSMYEEME